MRFDESFPARYVVTQLDELPGSGALDHEMTSTWGRIIDGGVLLAVTTEGGSSWTGLCANALGSVKGAQDGVYTTPAPDCFVVLARGVAYWINAFEPSAW